jgi:uracil-DNA glycosylase
MSVKLRLVVKTDPTAVPVPEVVPTPIPRMVLSITPAETWSVLDVAKRSPPRGWLDVFIDAEPEFEDISSIVENQEKTNNYKSYPLRRDIFAAFKVTPLNRVRLVIIGQDPYHGYDGCTQLPQAVGMSFSVRKGASIPVSLRNIFKEIQRSMPASFTMPNHGDLTSWAQQGVLLLNTCLTVRPSIAGSHGEIWMGFVVKALAALSEVRPDTIYMLWGAEAQKLRVKGHINDKAICLETSHPSGFSARRGFNGCDHFVTANELLLARGEAPIDWNLPE